MDLTPDGSLAAAVDWNRVCLLPCEAERELSTIPAQEGNSVEPVVAEVAMRGDKAYVLGSYEKSSGVRIYDWSGMVEEEKDWWEGSVADSPLPRSSSGNHICYLVTPAAMYQNLHCNGSKFKLGLLPQLGLKHRYGRPV